MKKPRTAVCFAIVFALVATILVGCTVTGTKEVQNNETETRPETEIALNPQPLSVLLLRNDGISKWEAEIHDWAAIVDWQYVVLTDGCAKQYPQLVDGLNDWYKEKYTYYEDHLAFLSEYFEQTYEETGEYHECYENHYSYVQRADSRILSVFSQYFAYQEQEDDCIRSGITSLNLDSATGKPVTIDQVLTDMDALPQLLEDALRKKYDQKAFDGTAKLLESYAPEDYTWTINYQGVTFYFEAEELAGGAAGDVTVTLWFNDHPDLFVGSYTRSPANGYAVALPLIDESDSYQDQDAEVEVDLVPGDGKTDRLYLAAREDLNMQIQLNQAHDQEIYVGSADKTYLVTPDNRNFYLYIECYRGGFLPELDVYALNSEGIVHVTTLEYLGIQGTYEGDEPNPVFNDPTHFTLWTEVVMLGWIGVTRSYHTDLETGIPQPDTDYYTCNLYWLEGAPKTSLIPLEVEILPEMTTETIPAGTTFYCQRTDDETYLDMRLEDGRECRIYVVRPDPDNVFEIYLNGRPEEECFEGIRYGN